MSTDEPQRNETIAQILEHHGVDTIDDLPDVVQNTLEATPNADLDETHPLAAFGRNR